MPKSSEKKLAYMRVYGLKYWHNLTPEEKANHHYKKTYGITLDEAKQKLKDQGNKCACCDDEIELGKGKGLIDHCHTKGHIRGVICFHCNVALGHAKDDIERLQKMIDYLNKGNIHYGTTN